MSQDPSPINASSTDDKFELHYRQQLSALVDGELAPDEARFLLRRMAHDGELSGRFERWQLCGDVLRGQVRRAAAPGLGQRIAAGIADGSRVGQSVPAPSRATRRQAWTRWGGGAALAASVAAVAMFVGRPLATDPGAVPAPALAVQTLPSTEAVLAAVEPAPVEVAPAPVQRFVEPAPARARAAAPRMVASARPSPAVSGGAATSGLADAVADAGPQFPAPATPALDPFASPEPLQARPWPRASVAQPGGSVYTARLGEPAAAGSFYPFEPRLPQRAEPGTEPPPPGQQDQDQNEDRQR